jgi:hypothetical protein
VKGYIARWGQSPSYGEIAAGTGSNRTRVKRAVVSLEKAGLLLRSPGTRGLALPDEIARAKLTLARAGLLPDEGTNRPAGPRGHAAEPQAPGALRRNSAEDDEADASSQTGSVTNPTLLPPPALDYPAGRDRADRGTAKHGNSGSSAT